MNLPMLVVVFVLAGVYVATEEALEDSLAAELVDKDQHGMGLGCRRWARLAPLRPGDQQGA
jgi:hypothetical protein